MELWRTLEPFTKHFIRHLCLCVWPPFTCQLVFSTCWVVLLLSELALWFCLANPTLVTQRERAMSSTDGSESEDTATASPSVATTCPTIAAVNLKLPPFWSSDPEVWFKQVEAQFRTRHITAQSTKFDHINASLSPEFATVVWDLIIRPPVDAPYDSLRQTHHCFRAEEAAAAVQCRRVGRLEAITAPT